MSQDRKLSQTCDLISAVWTGLGELTRSDKKKFSFFIASPLSSNSCEVGFRGAVADGFFERIKESISKLPSHHETQLVFDRSVFKTEDRAGLFPAFGLETTLFLIESEASTGGTTLKQLFEDLGLTLRPGEKSDYVALIQKFLGQERNDENLILPDLVWEEEYLKAGKCHIKAASLTDLPLSTWNNSLQSLLESGDEFLCSFKLAVPDKTKSRKHLETKRRVSHALSARKAHELSDLESGSNLSASEEILVRVTQGKESLLNMSLSVFMRDETLSRLSTRMQNIVSDANGATGAGFFIESLGTLPVLKAHLPGAKSLPVRELQMLSGNLSQMLPLFLDYGREQDAASLKFVSRSAEVSHLNLFSKANLNFNAFVCGASGSGKSFLMNSMLAGFREDNPDGSLAIFDVGGSYRKLIGHYDGSSLNLDPKSTTELIAAAFKRLAIQPTGFCKTLVENICGAGTHITHSHKVAIEDLLQTCAGAPFSLKLLSNEAAEKKEKAYEDIILWLRPYLHWDYIQAGSGAERILDAKIRAFDFKQLESDPLLQRLSILILTQGIWDRLEKKHSEKTIIVFDEVWKFFAEARGFLEEMYRTFRKYGAGIVSVTQSMSDYGDEAFAKLVISTSFSKILLQGAASSDILTRTLDLNESDIARFLSVASKKNEYSEFWLGLPKGSQILRHYPSKALFQLANSENIQSEGVRCA